MRKCYLLKNWLQIVWSVLKWKWASCCLLESFCPIRKLLLIAQVRFKVEISRGSFGSWIELHWQGVERYAQCRCLLLSKSCSKALALTNCHFLHHFEVKIQKRGRKNSMFICINSVLSDAIDLKTVPVKKISSLFLKARTEKKAFHSPTNWINKITSFLHFPVSHMFPWNFLSHPEFSQTIFFACNHFFFYHVRYCSISIQKSFHFRTSSEPFLVRREITYCFSKLTWTGWICWTSVSLFTVLFCLLSLRLC